jgi:single-strand DNA-binding protein
MQINTVALSGQCISDVETKTVGGSLMATFILEQQQNTYRQGKATVRRHSWKVQCWNRTAEVVGEYVAKGKNIVIQGQLESNSWKGKDGKWNNETIVKAASIDLVR